MPAHRSIRRLVLLVGFYALLTVVCTYPHAFAWYSIPDHSDPLFSIWRLEWVAHQVVRNPAALFDANVFYPTARTLALSDATLLQAALSAPLLWLGTSGVVAYNLLVLGSFVASGMALHLLVERESGSTPAAIVAGTIATCAPYRIDHIFHLELLFAFWTPLALVATARALRIRTRRAALLAALCVVAQFASCIYYGVFLGTLLVPWCIALFALGAVPRDRQTILTGLAVGAIVIIVLVPYALPYVHNAREVGARGLGETTLYSARPVHYLTTTWDSPFFGWSYNRWGGNEKQLFAGITPIVLALVALASASRRRVAAALWVVILVAVDLSLGVNGLTFPWLRDALPVYHGLRVPARAAALVAAVLALTAGFGMAWLCERRTFRESRVRTALLTLAVVGLIAAEYWHAPLALAEVPRRADALQRWLANHDGAIVLELPAADPEKLPGPDAWYQFRSTFHWRPLVNGYSGVYPPSYLRFLTLVRDMPSGRALVAIRASGATHIILHEDGYPPERFVRIRQWLDAEPGVESLLRLPTHRGAANVYRLRP